ncbi:hypothetical protein GCM10010357_56710 [Streptomyces luteireticuli]|uniref:Uncharacterized protein n=1 Tax=Streptomyces luteireticuli TaxID=173858 RepID=A0ABN0Z0R4_9ACTN
MPPLGEPAGRFRGPEAQPRSGPNGRNRAEAQQAQPERGPGGEAPGGAQGRSPATRATARNRTHRAKRGPAHASAQRGSRRGAAPAETAKGRGGEKTP